MADVELTNVEKQEQKRLADIKRLHESFLLSEDEIAKYLDSGINYLELKKICLCSYITKKPVAEIVEMRKKLVWTRTMYLLGLDAVTFAEGEKNYKADRLNRLFGIDRELLMKYLNMGFASHQIKRAYYISTHCDKPILEILEMKTRAQKWPDIAESLGLPRETCMCAKGKSVQHYIVVDAFVFLKWKRNY